MGERHGRGKEGRGVTCQPRLLGSAHARGALGRDEEQGEEAEKGGAEVKKLADEGKIKELTEVLNDTLDLLRKISKDVARVSPDTGIKIGELKNRLRKINPDLPM